MASQEHLSSAPISEALLDVRVVARPDLQASEFESLLPVFVDRFPLHEQRRNLRLQTEFKDGKLGTPRTDDLLHGYFLKSADGLDVAQLRVDGFTLNRLKPYQSWEIWFPLFERVWSAYLGVARPLRITRLATRAINHIPFLSGALQDYLVTPPSIPSGLPNRITAFLNSVTIDESFTQGMVLTQALEPTDPNGTPRLTIDIDAYETGDFAPHDIVGRFPALRAKRNLAFFESITDHAKGAFR